MHPVKPLAPATGPVLERIATTDKVVGDTLNVRRALPNPVRRMVGAWCFLDHAGPMTYAAGEGLSVGPHPHIGLQTFTWMIDGEVMHHDSLGNLQMVRPGQVNIMTAGRGISHAEISPETSGRIHAAQLWIALPDHARHQAPAFHHHAQLPTLLHDGFRCTVLAGSAFGETAPTQVHSPLLGIDFHAEAGASTVFGLNPAFEHAMLCLEGSVTVAGDVIEPGTLLYLGTGRDAVDIACIAPARALLLGGEPFGEEILLWWNFVARTQAELEAATHAWNHGEGFGEVTTTQLPKLKAPDITGLHLRA